MMKSAFEQFEMVSVLYVFRTDVFMVLAVLLVSLLVLNGSSRLLHVVGHRYARVSDLVYAMVGFMAKNSIGARGKFYIAPMLVVMILVLFSNLLGLIPYSYSITSQLVVTLALAGGIWIGKLVVGVNKHGLSLLGMFIPSGLPFGMVPFFVVVELIGFCIPLVSLSVRLFANIMSGHVLVKVLFGFVFIGSVSNPVVS